jgi:predicted O-methyltransferase YrrM
VSGFDEAFARARDVEGWLTEGQARRLWDRASELSPGATVVEIGSFRGRSAIVIASALPDRAQLVAIDPHGGGDRGPQEIASEATRGQADHDAFKANLERAGVSERVRHVRLMSSEALGAVDGEVDLLYIDGAHRFSPARDDLVRWGARVRSGGVMLVHDSFSSIGVTLATLASISFGRRWRYAGRTRTLAEFRRDEVEGSARLANAARQLAQLPWFAWNVLLKVLITAHVVRRPWPY